MSEMSAFDITFNFLIQSVNDTMRISQMELDSLQNLIGDTEIVQDSFNLNLFMISISEESCFWSSWTSKSPVKVSKRTYENPFTDFISLETKKSYLSLSELKDVVHSCLDHDHKNSRKSQIRKWLKSQRL